MSKTPPPATPVEPLVRWLRDEAGGPMAMNPEHQDVCNMLTKCADTLNKLCEVINHCWIHSGYQYCGRQHMASDIARQFDLVIGSECIHRWELDEREELAVCRVCGTTDSIDVM